MADSEQALELEELLPSRVGGAGGVDSDSDRPLSPQEPGEVGKTMTGLEASPGPFVGGLFHTDKEQMLRHNLKVTREKELEVETRKRITPEEKEHLERSVFFEDNKRRIDFMLAYRLSKEEKKFDLKIRSKEEKAAKNASRTEKRDAFLAACVDDYHLELETQDCSESPDHQTYFVKVHIPWEQLLEGAEKIGLRMPINDKLINLYEPWHVTLLEQYFGWKNPLKPTIPEEFRVQPYLTAPFSVEKKDLFIGCNRSNSDKFFTPAQRSMIAFDILQRIRYGEKEEQYGIQRLVDNGSFDGAFPLHDGPYSSIDEMDVTTERQLLYRKWARWTNWYKNQPLHHIRRYFGEKVGLYFTWLGHYTTWLIFATIVGILVMLYGVTTLYFPIRNPIAADACGEPRTKYTFLDNTTTMTTGPPPNHTFYMCPICDIECDFWYYQDECMVTWFSLLFDNLGTVIFAAFISIWAVLFMEMWKRRQFVLQHEWDVLGFEAAEENPRVEFTRSIRKHINKQKTQRAKMRYLQYNAVYDRYELTQPKHRLLPKIIAGFSGLLFMVVVVLGIVFGVLVYRAGISILLVSPLTQVAGSLAGTSVNLIVLVTGAGIQLIFIMIMNVIYQFVAEKLTNWELHRTQTEYEDSLITKLYIFQFVNFYTSIFYVAFFKGTVVGYPGNYQRIGRLRLEECATYGCFLEVTIQLAIILCGKQILYNAIELGVPLLKWIMKRLINLVRKGVKGDIYTRWERDYDLPAQNKFGLLPEYLEEVIQFGFVTIFVASFPLAPLFALLNNIVEIRLDAYKYVVTQRRPVAERAQDIGAWYSILDVVAKMAVITNACLIAFTATFIPMLVHRFNGDAAFACQSHAWPSCTALSNHYDGNEYYGQGGFLNSQIQNFELKVVFDELRGYSLNQSDPAVITTDAEIIPDVRLYKLRAYAQNETSIDYLFLPFIDLPCMKQRTNWTGELRYDMFTSDFVKNETIYQNVPYCILASTTCGYRGFGRTGERGKYPLEYWQVLTAQLAFVLVFEHAIFLLVIVIAWAIPDVPQSVKDEIKREKVLALKSHLGQSAEPLRQPDTGLLEEHHLEVERRAEGEDELEHLAAVIRRNE